VAVTWNLKFDYFFMSLGPSKAFANLWNLKFDYFFMSLGPSKAFANLTNPYVKSFKINACCIPLSHIHFTFKNYLKYKKVGACLFGKHME
jgi:hypothetical protein